MVVKVTRCHCLVKVVNTNSAIPLKMFSDTLHTPGWWSWSDCSHNARSVSVHWDQCSHQQLVGPEREGEGERERERGRGRERERESEGEREGERERKRASERERERVKERGDNCIKAFMTTQIHILTEHCTSVQYKVYYY